MKVKTSITLSEELLREMDRWSDQYGNRSAIIEQAIRAFLDRAFKEERDARDLDILNRLADSLNAEAEDVLQYQVQL